MEEERVAGLEFHVNELHHLHGFVCALGVSAGLVAVTAMFDTAHFVGAFQNLQATVGAGVGIDGNEGGAHVGPEAAVLVPVTVILMPTPRAAGARLLDAHLAVVMIHLIAQQRFHGVDDPLAAGDGAPEIFAGGIPKHELRLAAFAVLEIVGVVLEGFIGLRGGAQDAGFLGIKQAGDDEVTVLFKGRNLVGGNRRHAATMPSGPPTVNRLCRRPSRGAGEGDTTARRLCVQGKRLHPHDRRNPQC